MRMSLQTLKSMQPIVVALPTPAGPTTLIERANDLSLFQSLEESDATRYSRLNSHFRYLEIGT